MNKVLICITGGIAAYKIPILCRILKRNNFDVKVVMTENAVKFITPLTLESITENTVYIDTLEYSPSQESIEHISLAKWTDIVIVAPATANTIAKMVCGIADNLLTCLLLACYKKPIYICPAMNTNMYTNPITLENIQKLTDLGYKIINPVEGELACNDVGIGKMQEPEAIFAFVRKDFNKTNLINGLKVIVTAGPTREYLDPVRFISNRSSGRMGFSLAENAENLGADVELISGPIPGKSDVDNITYIESAEEMLRILKKKISSAHILIMAAAVSDFKAESYESSKIKKNKQTSNLILVPNTDILMELAKIKKEHQVFVGFAAETNDVEENAVKKLNAKNLDMIVANDVSRSDIGFDSVYNEVTIYYKDGKKEKLDKMLKSTLSHMLIEKIYAVYKEKNNNN